MDVTVKGAEDLERVAKALKAAGAGDLRKELLKGIREAGKPVVQAVKDNISPALPDRGGLAARVAGSKFAVRNRLAGKSAGVRIVATSDMPSIDTMDRRGFVRHPTFGDRKKWVSQRVPAAGWFSEPIASRADGFRKGIQRAMDDVANKIEGAA